MAFKTASCTRGPERGPSFHLEGILCDICDVVFAEPEVREDDVPLRTHEDVL